MSSFKMVLLLVLISSAGVLEAAMEQTNSKRAFQVRVALPHCVVNHDCAPLCEHCGFCACLNGLCYRGCKDQNVVALDIFGRKIAPQIP